MSTEPASNMLASEIYSDLKRVAASYLKQRPVSVSINPTILVHEAFIRLVEKSRVCPSDREHFMALSAKIMRQILVDHTRKHLTRQNVIKKQSVRLDMSGEKPVLPEYRLLEIDEAIQRLAKSDPRQAQIVELKFFGGLSIDAIAQHLGVSSRTVQLDWRMAKAWLASSLDGDDHGS